MKKYLILIVLLTFGFSPLVKAQKVGVSLNAADAVFLGTISAEGQYAVAQHLTASVSGSYNPWTWKADSEDEQFQRRRRSVAAGVRYWPWYVYSGWWVSADLQWQEYNEARIFTREARTEEGDRFGLRFGAGYTVMINHWFNVDFGIRGFGGATKYVVYECPVCGSIVDSGTKAFVLPDQLVVSAMFIF